MAPGCVGNYLVVWEITSSWRVQIFLWTWSCPPQLTDLFGTSVLQPFNYSAYTGIAAWNQVVDCSLFLLNEVVYTLHCATSLALIDTKCKWVSHLHWLWIHWERLTDWSQSSVIFKALKSDAFVRSHCACIKMRWTGIHKKHDIHSLSKKNGSTLVQSSIQQQKE